MKRFLLVSMIAFLATLSIKTFGQKISLEQLINYTHTPESGIPKLRISGLGAPSFDRYNNVSSFSFYRSDMSDFKDMPDSLPIINTPEDLAKAKKIADNLPPTPLISVIHFYLES